MVLGGSGFSGFPLCCCTLLENRKKQTKFTFSVAVIGFDLISIKEQKISWADLLFYQVFEN